MEPSVLKRLLVGGCFLALLLTGLWHMGFRDLWRTPPPETVPAVQPPPADNATGGVTANATAPVQTAGGNEEMEQKSALHLAFKTINLFQGEDGFTLWRLQADWANLRQQDGIIMVETPALVYHMPPNNEELYVNSATGEVDQKNKIIRFVQNVVVTHKNSTMTGNLLIYNGTSATMSLPERGLFQGQGVSGSADTLVWYMNKRTINASGNVVVDFSAPAKKKP